MKETFLELKKASKNIESTYKKIRLSILGDSSTQHLAVAIKGQGAKNNFDIDIYNADYDQIKAQVLDTTSELYSFNPEYVLLYMCQEKLYEEYCLAGNKKEFANNKFNEIKTYWHALNMNIIQTLFVEENDNVFGTYGLKEETSFIFQLKKLNYLLLTNQEKNVHLIDINEIRGMLGEEYKDNKNYYMAKLALSLDGIVLFSKKVVDVIKAITGSIKKCVICDLDNTLWGGVIGDDGMSGIEIGDLGQGHAFSDLQTWLKQLKERGIILGICSKNDEKNAKEPFISHPDMVLRLDDISIFVANWNDKATNIRYIQKTLNIGMDSIVFIDDNPFERNLVKETVEGICVPDLPEDPSEYLTYLKSLNLFETASFSENDKERTKQYQAEVNRLELEAEFQNYDEYLINLDMIADVKPFEKFYFPRIAQLTQRSNQFNLRTVRYTEDEIEKISNDQNKITRYFTLKDRFGDHGLISVLILDKKEDALFISEWLMSCRVLKRGMEEFIINKIVSIAKENGYKKIVGEYLKTTKNSMVEHIYEDHGFKKIDDTKYELNVEEYVDGKSYIKEINY